MSNRNGPAGDTLLHSAAWRSAIEPSGSIRSLNGESNQRFGGVRSPMFGPVANNPG
jgi:hypothetical protein